MKSVIGFVLGAAAGSLLTWKLVEEKYRQIANDEIESVREHYINKNKENSESNIPEHFEDEEIYADEIEITDVKKAEYEEKVKDLGYSDDMSEAWIEPGSDYIAPVIISPEEYGDNDFEMKSLTYYADFVLADNDGDEIVSDPESIIGNALNHFGEYENDAVHVRNFNDECDYEILKHEKTFSEIVGGQD